MKFSTKQAFEKHLEEAGPEHFSPVYLILCGDSYERKQIGDHLIGQLLQTEEEKTVREFSGEKIDLQELLDELESLSFFSGKRAVRIGNGEKLNKSVTTKIEAYAAKPNPSVYLIIAASSLNRGTTFYKKLEKNGIVCDLPEEKPWEKERSAVQRAIESFRAKGKSIDQQTAQLLLKHLGTDYGLLENEIEKLVCYVGGRSSITKEDISAVSSSLTVENLWQLRDALMQRDASTALKIGNGLIADGEPLFSLLRQVRGQYQTMCHICTTIQSGGGAVDVQGLFPYMRGQILSRNLQTAQSLGIEKCKDALVRIDAAERNAKNGDTDHSLLLELLIFQLTAK